MISSFSAQCTSSVFHSNYSGNHQNTGLNNDISCRYYVQTLKGSEIHKATCERLVLDIADCTTYAQKYRDPTNLRVYSVKTHSIESFLAGMNLHGVPLVSCPNKLNK